MKDSIIKLLSMIFNKFIFVFVCSFLTISCKGQDSPNFYNTCMERQLKDTGIDFYGTMQAVENKLFEIGALKSKDRAGYISAFESLIVKNDSKWKNYLNELNSSVLEGFDIEFVKLHVISFCSDIILDDNNFDCDCLNTHKFFLKKFNYKPYDDDETLDGLLLFTDFKNNTFRYNLSYILLLNMEDKFK